MLLISDRNPNICFTCITKLVKKFNFIFCRTFSKVKKMYCFSWARHAKKNYFMTMVKFSFQTLKFVTNIKADNSIMCLWFQTA